MLKNLNSFNPILSKIILIFIFFVSSSLFSISAKAADQTVEMLNKLGKENMVFSKKIVNVDIGDTVFWKATKSGHNVEFIKGGVPAGVDKFRSKLNKVSLELIGDISWPEHVSIFTAPIRFALSYKIPLILYGENPQIEYGGPKKSLSNYDLNRKWMEEFGGLIGLRVSDLIEIYGFTKKELSIYIYPSAEELNQFKIKSIFLGYFEKWDSIRNYQTAKKNGFKEYKNDLEGCYFNFEKIDNYQHGIHDYFKYLKFGFARATDQLSYMIRRNKISREDGIKLAQKMEGKYPKSYMGKSLDKILAKIEISEEKFLKICDDFTNKKIFKTDQGGKLVKDENGSLTKLKYDN